MQHPRLRKDYCCWRGKDQQRQLIPYVLRAATRSSARSLEGRTYADAIIVNIDNGFALMVEAKVLSDISTVIAFDLFRNQLARNLDIMLDESVTERFPLSCRSADRSLLALLSPRWFRVHWSARLYGWLFHQYRDNPTALARDLPHRSGIDWEKLATRLGWMSFEDVAECVPRAFSWLRAGT